MSEDAYQAGLRYHKECQPDTRPLWYDTVVNLSEGRKVSTSNFKVFRLDLRGNCKGSIAQEEYSKKFRQGCSCYFLGLKFDELLFFGVAQNDAYFWRFKK